MNDSFFQNSLIIPDTDNNTPDTTVGKIKIKQESLKSLKASTPMTTVFTDSVDVKIKVSDLDSALPE